MRRGEFPEWDAVCTLRAQVRARLDELMASPDPVLSGKARQFLGHVQAAEDSDRVIEGNMAALRTGGDPAARANLMNAIQQALQFYTQLETRLNQLATQGK